MWYFKQTAKNIWNASKTIIDSRTSVQKLIDSIACSQQQIISTNKLNQLVALTFDSQTFNEALQLILRIIKVFKYDLQQAKKNLNVLIAVNYLIKHGATGFVDQLRSFISVFKNYQSLQDKKTYEDQVLQKQLSYQLEKIKSRARHIQILLSDKQKLLKQKQLAMLIKQKMKLYETTKIYNSNNKNLNNDNRDQRLEKQRKKNDRQSGNDQNKKLQNLKDYTDKIDGFMQKYLWKYVDKIDGKLQLISQKVMENFDKYVIGQLPQNFQPQDLDDQKTNSHHNEERNTQIKKLDNYQSLNDDENFMKKLQEEISSNRHLNLNENLLDFQQIIQKQLKDKVQQQSLI